MVSVVERVRLNLLSWWLRFLEYLKALKVTILSVKSTRIKRDLVKVISLIIENFDSCAALLKQIINNKMKLKSVFIGLYL
jgi:hypothetical protein